MKRFLVIDHSHVSFGKSLYGAMRTHRAYLQRTDQRGEAVALPHAEDKIGHVL
jgi:hypothetical protein